MKREISCYNWLVGDNSLQAQPFRVGYLTVLLTILTIVFCKGLERVMYYLDAKRLADQERQRAEKAEQRAEQEKQRAEQEKQRAEQAEQRAERAERLLEETKKNKS